LERNPEDPVAVDLTVSRTGSSGSLLNLGVLVVLAVALLWTPDATGQNGPEVIVVEDFESYEAEGVPDEWMTTKGSHEPIPVTPETMDDRERYIIKSEDSNKFVRAIVNDQAHRLIKLNDDGLDWDVTVRPILSWEWRAIELPKGAREDQRDRNDTGAAVYVYFGKDWLGRPRGIKYTYSSTLPVGTTKSYGPLKVLVVATPSLHPTGKWYYMARDVEADYRKLHGKDPSPRPSAILLWSDSDTMDTTAIADFDNIVLGARR